MADFDGLDLNLDFNRPRKHPVQWVAVAPPLDPRVEANNRRTRPKRNRDRGASRSRESNAGSDSGAGSGGTPVATARESRRTRKARAKGELAPDEHVQDGPPVVPAAQIGTHSISPPPGLPHFARENDDGNVEYKLRLKQPTPFRFQQLATQMKYRLCEGNGVCFYYLGVEDDGNLLGLETGDLEASLDTLNAMTREVGATATIVRRIPGAPGRHCAIVRVTRLATQELSCTDLRIAVAGSVDSGKSTLVACLTHGSAGSPLLDNGHGSARMAVFRHKHEIESGRTSSLSQQLLGYAADGSILNYQGVAALTPAEISQAAAHVLRFIDLGGHERFMKTALYGMTCMLPDFMLLTVCGVRGLGHVGRQHLAVALALEVPLLVAVTKAEVAERSALDALTTEIRDMLEAAVNSGIAAGGLPGLAGYSVDAPVVASEQQAAALARGMANNRMSCLVDDGGGTLTVPIFHVSSVSGTGLALLHAFLRALPTDGYEREEEEPLSPVSPAGDSSSSSEAAQDEAPAHFQVDHTFEVRGVGSVVSGTAVKGSIAVGHRLLLGPNSDGDFTSVVVSGIQRSQVPVGVIKAGQTGTLAIHSSRSSPLPPLPLQHAQSQQQLPRAHSSEGPEQSMALAGAARRQRQLAAEAEAAARHRQSQADTAYQEQQLEDRISAVSFAEPAAAPAAADSRAESDDQAEPPAQDAMVASLEAELPEESAWLQEMARERERNAVPWLRAAAADETPVSQRFRPGTGLTRASASAARPSSMSVTSPVAIPRSANGASPDRMVSRTGSAPSLLGTSPVNARKGAVLLDAALQPRTVWEFEAVMVLLSGHWPPRGLLSGQWPLQEAAAGSDSGSDSDAQRPSGSFSDVGACLTSDGGVSPRETTTPPSAAARGFGVAAGTGSSSCHMPSNSSSVAARRRRRRRRRQQQSSSRRHSGSTASGLYLPVVHCGSVRQAARVVAMREVALDDDAALGSSLASAVAAAAALLGDGGQGNGVLSSPGASGSIGCATAVTLQFVNRPEWLQAGARLILRDQGDGCAAGAGIVRKLYWGVVPPSARDAAGDCGVKLRPSIDSACSDLQAARL